MTYPNNLPNPVWRLIDIEDTSDCETCERRHREQFELLTQVKCKLLERLTCQECYRTYDLFVAEEPTP